MTSPWLERESQIVRMAAALKRLSCADLDQTLRRAGAYAKAGIDKQYFGPFDAMAFDREKIRRTRLAPVYVARDAMALGLLVVAFYGGWLATPAYAASAPITRAGMTGEDWFGVACLAVMAAGIRIYVLATYPRKISSEESERDERDERNMERRYRDAQGAEP